ncbi:MAG: hypothetical protein M1820_006715 [Bogoriella megaspora]|nr:MAG: hypothetical protein M1820_006715 [Bogoriella megaspora]
MVSPNYVSLDSTFQAYLDIVAPKTTTNATKLNSIITYFHQTSVAHSLRDLEKALPSIASINGMQVKDYLQALQDENKIHVEKIGSGNWYWSFAGEEKANKSKILEATRAENEKVKKVVEDLKKRVDEMEKERADESGENEEMVDGTRSSRGRNGLAERMHALERDVNGLQKELETYAESDPVEMDRKKRVVEEMKKGAEKWTDDICGLEGWLKEHMGGDREQFLALKRQTYGDEFDEEDEGLREV